MGAKMNKVFFLQLSFLKIREFIIYKGFARTILGKYERYERCRTNKR
jgi:hypothetical protein